MVKTADPLLSLVAQIVSSYVEHNATPSEQLPGLIREVFRALAAVERRPAGQIAFEDHVICMECGQPLKMLKRHLQTAHNKTPAQYREKWRLPRDYPLVARRYAELRSGLARESGLGKRPASRRG